MLHALNLVKKIKILSYLKVVISRGSGVTTDVFHDVPLLSDEPSLSADVLNLLQAAGIAYY